MTWDITILTIYLRFRLKTPLPDLTNVVDSGQNLYTYVWWAKFLYLTNAHCHGSYELTQSPEKVWGGPDEKGNWNGMLGMLQREVSYGG